MKIGILGSGQVAQVLGKGFIDKGHQVKLGTRSPHKLDEWLTGSGENASVGSFSEVAEYGDIIFLCTLGSATIDIINSVGADKFASKVVVDVTNPLDFSNGAPPKLDSSPSASLAEKIQSQIPDAHVVKAFNTVSVFIMVNPKLQEGTATMFISGNDTEAKKSVSKLAEDFGWEAEDLGGLENAYLLEAHAMLWITYGFKNNHWSHAFKLLKK